MSYFQMFEEAMNAHLTAKTFYKFFPYHHVMLLHVSWPLHFWTSTLATKSPNNTPNIPKQSLSLNSEEHSLGKMDKSATYETGDYCSYEFDYQTDFTQFLDEARKNANHAIRDTNFEETRKEQLDHVMRSRKSLKCSLLSWLKIGKKSKSAKQPTKTKLGHVSGPVEATRDGAIGRARRAASGPLVGFMNSTRRPDEYEVPYMCLDQLNNPHKIQSYGPIYLVT